MVRVVGVDVGERRVGIAVSDPSGILASPHSMVEATGRARGADAVAAVAHREDTDRVVVGLPLSLNGTEGPQAARIRRFADALTKLGLQVELWDERLTTTQAHRYLREGGASRKKQRTLVDMTAAAIILQSYLDAHRAAPSP